MKIRTQLSLYVPRSVSAPLEALRRLLDPIQASLIPAHVTLCREEELEGLDLASLRARLAAAESTAFTLRFGPPKSFYDHGVLLPCLGGEEAFQALRRQVLGASMVRRQAAHLTLAHPRNPQAPGNNASNFALIPSDLAIRFTSVRRIQQAGSQPWQVLERHSLGRQ